MKSVSNFQYFDFRVGYDYVSSVSMSLHHCLKGFTAQLDSIVAVKAFILGEMHAFRN